MSMANTDFINWLKVCKDDLERAGGAYDQNDIQSAMKLLRYFDQYVKYPDVRKMTMQEILDFLNSTDPMTLSLEDLDEEIKRAISIGCETMDCGVGAYSRTEYLYGVRHARLALLEAVPSAARDGVARQA